MVDVTAASHNVYCQALSGAYLFFFRAVDVLLDTSVIVIAMNHLISALSYHQFASKHDLKAVVAQFGRSLLSLMQRP